jgi:multidrug efflux pump subunit AcrB
MNSLFFASNPRAAILLVLLLFAAGFGSLATMGRQEDPSLTRRFATAVTTFPGASAERIEALVTKPLTDAIRELPEIREVQATSRAGISIIAIETREDINEAQVEQTFTEVREKIAQARTGMPDGVNDTSLSQLYIGAATMVVSIGWADEDPERLGMLQRLAGELQDRFQALPGTEETELFGEASEEVRVLVDPDVLAPLGLTTVDIATALQLADAKTPAGQFEGASQRFGVEVDGEFAGLTRIRSVPLALGEGASALRIGDIARVEKGIKTPPDAVGIYNDQRVIMVAAYLTSNLRVDHWTAQAQEVVADFRAAMPPDLEVQIVFEQNTYVERRLNGLAGNLVVSAFIVFGVLFVLMGWRSAIVVGTALPLTIVTVLAIINITGEPLHQMSVTGIVIALGMLIDNAIVMADEYSLRRRKGESQLDAARHSVHYLFMPLLASTLTTILAFMPIATLPGSAGEFVGYIGWSVVFAVGVSFLLAMTIIPAFLIWLDGRNVDHSGAGGLRFWENGLAYSPLTGAYRQTLRFALERPVIGIGLGFALAGVGFVAAGQLPLQFFPATDRDAFQVSIVLPGTTSIGETLEATRKVSSIIRQEEGILDIGWVAGEGPPRTYYNVISLAENEPNYAGAFVRTTSPQATRKAVLSLQTKLRDALPEAQVLALPFEQGPPVPAPIEMRIIGPDLETLDRLGDELRLILSQSVNVTYTTSSLRLGSPVIRLDADERAAQLTGQSLTGLARLLQADLDGVRGGSVLEGNEELPVRVLLSDAARGSVDSITTKALPASDGSLLPVSALGDVRVEPQVALISQTQGERDNAIFAYLTPYAFADTTVQDFQARLARSGFEMPAGYRLQIGGEAEARGDAVGNLLALAVPLIIMIIGALVLAFNSFRRAAIVGIIGLQSIFIALLGVWLFDQPNGFQAIIGSLGLFGLSINGAIVVLTALSTEQRSAHSQSYKVIEDRFAVQHVIGKSTPTRNRMSKGLFWFAMLFAALFGRHMTEEADLEGIVDVTVDTTRHIVATTLTTMGGFLPLLLSGDPFWLPLSAAIAGGVAGSAILALYSVPAYHLVMMRRRRLREVRRAIRRGDALPSGRGRFEEIFGEARSQSPATYGQKSVATA